MTAKVLTLTEKSYSTTVENMGKTRKDADGTEYVLVRPIRTARRSGFWAKVENLAPRV